MCGNSRSEAHGPYATCSGCDLMSDLNAVQSRLRKLRLVINTDKTKLMLFSQVNGQIQTVSLILTSQGIETELVKS